jgi:hypothetical protein
MLKLICSLTALILISNSIAAALNNRPVIGIFAEYNEDFSKTYIASSYVKFAEMSGSRVVPVRSDLSYDEL